MIFICESLLDPMFIFGLSIFYVFKIAEIRSCFEKFTPIQNVDETIQSVNRRKYRIWQIDVLELLQKIRERPNPSGDWFFLICPFEFSLTFLTLIFIYRNRSTNGGTWADTIYLDCSTPICHNIISRSSITSNWLAWRFKPAPPYRTKLALKCLKGYSKRLIIN